MGKQREQALEQIWREQAESVEQTTEQMEATTNGKGGIETAWNGGAGGGDMSKEVTAQTIQSENINQGGNCTDRRAM